MVKIISFDFDGTLVKRTYADKVWLEGLPKIYAKEKKIPLKQAKKYILQEYDKIGKDRKEWYDINWWFKKFQLKENWQDLLDSYRHTVQLFPETIETLDTLSKKYELIIISNSKREFIDTQLEETNIGKYFANIFSSTSDFDRVKKLPEIYKIICDSLKISPYEMVHVGDDREFDFENPKMIGIKSFFLDREVTEVGDHTIRKLSDLVKVI